MTPHTVDGSEIPRPTTWDGGKTLYIMRETTNLNWSAGFLNHQQYHFGSVEKF